MAVRFHLAIILLLCLCKGLSATKAEQQSAWEPLIVGEGGHFKSIQAAVNAVPTAMNDHRYLIVLLPGIYRETVVISAEKPPITLQGLSRNVTVITSNGTASLPTLPSSTFAVYAAEFIARSVTFQNTGNPKSEVLEKQATALLVSGDRSAFYDCAILGLDSALYDRVGRHYFRDCLIHGSNDVIVGSGQSIYKRCEISVMGRGSVTAQSRQNRAEQSGFSFVDCRITGLGNFFLGRAWGPYSRVVFISTYMDDVINRAGWSDLGEPTRDSTVLFGEYRCSGPGSNNTGRVHWSLSLSEVEAAPFLDLDFINGHDWLLYV